MAYLAPSIEAMLKSRLTKPGLLKVMAAPDTKAKLQGNLPSNMNEVCDKLGVDYVLKGKITSERGEPRISVDVFAKGTAAPITSSILSPHNLDEIIPKVTELSATVFESVLNHTPTKLAKAEDAERPVLIAVAPDDDKQNLLRMNPAKLLQRNITAKEKDDTLQALAKTGEGQGTPSKDARPTMAGAEKTAMASPTAALASIQSHDSERPVLISNAPAPSSNLLATDSVKKQESWWNRLMPWQKDKENEPVATINADKGGLPYPTINELMSRYKRPEPIQPLPQISSASSKTTDDGPQTRAIATPQKTPQLPQTTADSTDTAGADTVTTKLNSAIPSQKPTASAQASQTQSEKKGFLSWLPNPFNSGKTETQASTPPKNKEASNAKNTKETATNSAADEGPIWQWY
jgi:TolB-like protein